MSTDLGVAGTPAKQLDLHSLGFDRGGHLLLKRDLGLVPVGATVAVYGSDEALPVHLRGWCRQQGHAVTWPSELGEEARSQPGPQGSPLVALVRRGAAQVGRWREAEKSGGADPKQEGSLVEQPPAFWGVAGRSATVERGAPEWDFSLNERDELWAEEVPRIYNQALAAQWDPNTAVDWDEPFELPEEVEDAVVQVMTYLIENEMAALVVPSKFLAQIHPHFREVMQLLAIQAADEARHVEVFTRRGLLKRDELGLSTAGGQESLKTLYDEADFAMASFLLSVLGEGSFLSLLRFLRDHAPDPITRRISHLAAQDEARHVAFGMAHLRRHVTLDPTMREKLATAIRQRHAALEHTAGLNEEVFDALLLLAAGSWEIDALDEGYRKVLELKEDMDQSRRRRLEQLGFTPDDAAELSAMHTRNFM